MSSSASQSLTNKLSTSVVNHPVGFLVLSLVLFALFAMGNPYYRHTMNYHFFFSDDNPQLAAFEKLQSDYSKTEAVFIALAPANGDVFTVDNLQMLESFTTDAWQIPHSIRVDSMVNFQHTEGSEDGLDVYGLFEESMTLDASEVQRRKHIALQEPSLVNALVSNDSRVAGVRVTINMPGVNLEKETPEVVLFVRALAAEYEKKFPGLQTYLTGQIVVDQAFPESTQSDFNFVWPAFLVVMMGLLVFIYRGVIYMLMTIITGVLSIGAGMGAVGWTELQVNAAVTAAPVMILTLAIADCIHILSSYTHQLKMGDKKQAAMIESLRVNMFPVFLTTFMTMIGFLTLHFNDSPPYRALGYVVAAGVVFALIFAVIFLPAVMMLIPHKLPKVDAIDVASDEQSERMWRLGEWVVRNSKSLLVGMGAISLFLTFSVLMNQINDNPIRYFGESQQMRQHLEFVNNHITGLGTLNYSIGSGEENGVADPDYLSKLDEFASWLESQPEVIQVDTLADVLKRINKSLHSDDKAYYRLPTDRESAAQYLLLYELSLPLGMDIGNILTHDKSASRVRVAMTNTEGRYHIELDKKAKQWLQDNAPETMWSEGASAPLMFAHIGKRSIDGMLGGLIGSLFLMSFILVWVLRSKQLGALSLVSNVIPVAMAFGFWGWINGNVDLGITVTFGIAFGIVVDDTIHFLSKYQRARTEQGKSTEEAIKYAFSTVGVALLVTSAVLIAGFSMLGFSQMNITSNMAILTTVTVFFAFVVDFFLLPPLLMKFDKD